MLTEGLVKLMKLIRNKNRVFAPCHYEDIVRTLFHQLRILLVVWYAIQVKRSAQLSLRRIVTSSPAQAPCIFFVCVCVCAPLATALNQRC